MGNKGSKMPKDGAEFFLGGPENFTYDQSKAVFEKNNGLLFRLINTQENQWAFYNDTKKFEFHVTVTFGAGSSNLVALGQTALTESPDGGWVAKSIVYPGMTVAFVQGEVAGFDSVYNAVLLTTEYKEKRSAEKKETKKAAKRAENGEEAAPDAEGGDLDGTHRA